MNTTARCGSCGNDCDAALAHTAATSCDAGTLTCKVTTCAAGYANCDGSDANGCETDIHTVNDCGGCSSLNMNTACTGLPNVASSTCGTGTCAIQTCNAGFLDCDQVVANGCERDGNVQGPCMPDSNCTQKTFGGHTYYFCQNDSSWSAARAKCQLQLGGDLTEITSSGENAFVQGNLTASANAWIGASDSDLEGLYEWMNEGVPFWRNGASVLGGYASWSSGEPSASASADDCVEIYAGGTNAGKWNDTACSTLKDFVCEVAADACTGDPSKWYPGQCGCGVADTDADADGFAVCNDSCESDATKVSPGVCGCGLSESSCGPGGDCTFKSYPTMTSTGYYVCSYPRSWDNARSVCNGIPGGGELVHVDDVTEDNFVKASLSANSWIGASDSAVEGQWRWSDDNSLFWSGNGSGSAQGGHYVHWSSTLAQPEGGNSADCAMWWQSNGGGWADESCSTAYPFVCEVPADACPASPKLTPGQCGCALADTDSDLDGVADCNDECPDDPELSVAGDCGCPSAAVADGTLCNDGTCAANMQCSAGRCGTITQCFKDNANVSVGYYHACARASSGKAYCWGSNGSGRLGDGTTLERHGPVEVLGLSDVREIAAGESHTCAIVGSGELYCWGNGATSRLGTGNTTDQLLPTKIAGITTAKQLAVGVDHSCVVLANGTVQCWGNGGSGRLGDN
ncbi:MAG TPA: lectin-like protein, partial [Polyangiales bacterium]|nr:lectin-like protein [Polyangiales bacterium]